MATISKYSMSSWGRHYVCGSDVSFHDSCFSNSDAILSASASCCDVIIETFSTINSRVPVTCLNKNSCFTENIRKLVWCAYCRKNIFFLLFQNHWWIWLRYKIWNASKINAQHKLCIFNMISIDSWQWHFRRCNKFTFVLHMNYSE